MGAFPSHSAPSGYSQEISLKKKSLALLQSSRSPDTTTQPTSPQPQPYPETYTLSASSTPSTPATTVTTRNTPAPNFADSPGMSDSQCTTTTSSPRTSDPGSTPSNFASASPGSDGDGGTETETGMSPTSSSPASDPSPSSAPPQGHKTAPPLPPMTVKAGKKRAAPSP